MPIYTRGGDAGDTSLASGSRASKASARVEAYGSVDEAVSAVGFARAAVADAYLGDVLRFLQQRLMNVAGSLASPEAAAETKEPPVSAADIAALETAIDAITERTGPFHGFVLPAGCEAATRLHLARAITRRAERRAVALAAEEPVEPLGLAFLNRASDLLFAAAGLANVDSGVADEPWDPASPPPSP